MGGAIIFTILIGNPVRVIVGEAMKANAAPAPQVEQVQQIPPNYEELCRTTGDYCEVPTKEQLQAEEDASNTALVNKLCSVEYEEVRAKIVYKALTSDVETPEEVKNYQAAIAILKLCPRNNVSY